MTGQRTVAQRLLELSASLGIDYIFTNLGSDHPAFIEAFALLKARGAEKPRVIVCPHEMTALSAAHGYAMVTRKPQLVLVHVDVGTQNLGGSIHNAARARVPAIIVAGLSPWTEHGKRTGRRNEFIHYIQDAPRQAEIVAQYMKWCYELRAPEMVDDVLLRAAQIAATWPQGPVYVTGAREVWDAKVNTAQPPLDQWQPVRLGGLASEAIDEIYTALAAAQRPIVITSYLGRQPAAVQKLVELSERIGIGVLEVSPHNLSFPGTHAHHLGYRRDSFVAQADLILMLDVDVPWIPSKVQPAPSARLFHVDLDPIKPQLGFWHFPAQRSYQADSLQVLQQLLARCDAVPPGSAARRAWLADLPTRTSAAASTPTAAALTPEEVTEAVRELVNERTIVVFEAPSCTELTPTYLKMQQPGSYFSSGGAGLGWGINAAIGAKLAQPDAEVIAMVGDGCYLFGVPSSAYWVAQTYATPHLTVIYNNRGWHSPKLSTLWVHPEGEARRNDSFFVTVGAGAKLAEIAAAASGAAAYTVTNRDQLRSTLREAMQTVRAGRCAVVDAVVAPVSGQNLG
jgi:acetolactate synthase-1/2/3 large subunit